MLSLVLHQWANMNVSGWSGQRSDTCWTKSVWKSQNTASRHGLNVGQWRGHEWMHHWHGTSHPLLWLNMPNISITDLVVSFLSSYLIRLTYDSHAVSMLLFSSHIMPHALLTPFISVQCMAMFYFFSSILPPPRGRLMHHFVSIPWPCLMHASTSCY